MRPQHVKVSAMGFEPVVSTLEMSEKKGSLKPCPSS